MVIGTRRTDVTVGESAAPVDIISADELLASGATNLGQALASQLPSFTFPQNTHGAFAQEVPAGASLRGLASDQVLVLINGKRRHTGSTVTRQNYSAKGGVPVDISLIPIDAIERIEVLRDGASAQYGSDAIAGVINIVLRGKDSGGRIAYRYGEYTKGDGESHKVSGWAGIGLGQGGFLTLSFDAGKSAPANDTNPDTRVAATNPYRNWRFGVGKVYDQFNIFANAELPLTSTLTAYAFGSFGRKKSDAESSLVLSTDRRAIASVSPNGFWPITTYDLEDFSITGGLRLDSPQLGRIDLSANFGRNSVDSSVRDSFNASWGPTSPTAFYTGRRINSQANVTLDWAKEVAVAGLAEPITLSAGIAYRWEGYELRAGEAAASENRWYPYPSGGYYTPASAGITPVDAGSISRDVIGGYVDVEVRPVRGLTVAAAGRIEHYSDFGSTTNGRLTARYDFTRAVALRGSISTGYRAPSLVQAGYQASGIQIVQTGNVYDAVLQRTLRADGPIAAALGGKPLAPEKSTNLSVGLVLRPATNASLTVDAYQIDIDNRITASENLTGTDVVQVLTAAGYPGVNSATFFTNILDTRTKGVEVAGRYRFTLGENARLLLTAGYSYNETKVTARRGVGNFTSDRIVGRQALGVLEDAVPKHKLNASAQLSWKDLDVTFNVRRYSSYISRSTTAASDQTFSPQIISDLDVAYKIGRIRLNVGAQNLFNSHPDLLNNTGTGAYGIAKYPVIAPEGHQGAFLYTSIALSF